MIHDLTKLELRFIDFHATNPEVYERVCELSADLIRRGAKKLSINMMFEIMRYERQGTTGKPFKLNDHMRPYYARLWNKQHPGTAKFNARGLGSKNGRLRSAVTKLVD